MFVTNVFNFATEGKCYRDLETQITATFKFGEVSGRELLLKGGFISE